MRIQITNNSQFISSVLKYRLLNVVIIVYYFVCITINNSIQFIKKHSLNSIINIESQKSRIIL